jgi:hypothetical protein
MIIKIFKILKTKPTSESKANQKRIKSESKANQKRIKNESKANASN